MMCRTLVVLAITLQMVLPFGAGAATGNDGLSRYLCNQSVSAVDNQAQTELRELLTSLGLDVDAELPEQNSDHCQDCILSVAVVTSAISRLGAVEQYFGKTKFIFQTFNGFAFNVRGPPLGSRAPPVLP